MWINLAECGIIAMPCLAQTVLPRPLVPLEAAIYSKICAVRWLRPVRWQRHSGTDNHGDPEGGREGGRSRSVLEDPTCIGPRYMQVHVVRRVTCICSPRGLGHGLSLTLRTHPRSQYDIHEIHTNRTSASRSYMYRRFCLGPYDTGPQPVASSGTK